MTGVTTVPETHMAILEALADEGRPLTADELIQKIGNRFPIKGTIGNMQALDRIESLHVEGVYKKCYKATKEGAALLKKKASLTITPYKPKDFKPRQNNKKALDASLPEPMLPTLNVSTTADKLMDTISSVIQENNAYREAIIRSCNQMAAMLGMKLVPINTPTETE